MKRVRIGLVFGLLAAIFLASLVHAAEPVAPPTPGLLLWSLETLTEARQRILGGDPGPYRAAFDKLKAEADLALGVGPFSVTYKKSTPPSGDKHDYVSIGIYWWPNPDTPNGLPYVRHDGKVNPEVNNDTFDKAAIGKMSAAVQSLALAYYLTGEERYAEHAAKLLRVWFLDLATRMNPNLNFGQSVPGVNDGRKEGIVETITFTNLGESAQLLSGSIHWREQEMKGL